jgi:DNA-binding protein HU-beta/integration host factor subunit beta
VESIVLTKKDIVRTISEEIGLTQQQTKQIVQKTFDAIIDSLVRERRIELRNFGVFEVKQRAARKARNPRTGRQVNVPEKFVVTFKPGKEMEAKVMELTDQAATPSPETLAMIRSIQNSSTQNNGTPVARPIKLANDGQAD